MSLLTTQGLTHSYGGPPLLESIDLRIDAGERLALVGRNGSGKSTLLKLLAGELSPDGGTLERRAGVRVARLVQAVPTTFVGDVFDIVASGDAELGALVAEYHHLSADLGERSLSRLARVQEKLEAAGGWQLHTRIETALSRLGLEGVGRFETLSGGLKRRVLMARALASQPDVLLLDEPTNHLDIEAIEWLEELLLGLGSTLLFVTHDRSFLRRLATRILELDRGHLRSYPGDYDRYLEKKEHEEEVEERQNRLEDKKLAREEAWIRQGIKARRTRNEGRVRALERLREEVRARQKKVGAANLRFESAVRSGKRVIETHGLTFGYEPGRPIVRDLELGIVRGDKIGILGPNGSGKTTLLRLLLGQQEPDAGSVRHGTRLEVAYFDQLRAGLDEKQSVADSLNNGDDHVEIGGKRRHVIGYLESFLFSPAQARSPVESLSGGERNRLEMARLFCRPFNVLVMDEPTNDLDIETLELLEERLVEFQGTLLLVSHDRTFLDNVVTSTLSMEGGGRVGAYAGGYSDWLLQRPRPAATSASGNASNGSTTSKGDRRGRKAQPKPKGSTSKRKLSYKETRDLEQLPARIEALEAQQQELHQRLADPEFYRTSDGDSIKGVQAQLAELEQELEAAYERWAELVD